MKAVLLALCLACATVGDIRPVMNGQEQAVHIIWTETYGMKDRPPLVRWITGRELSCEDKSTGRPGFWIPSYDGNWECKEGLTMSPLEVMVAYHGELSFAQTALAHELMHAKQARNFFIDSNHTSPEWGMVDVANRRVAEAGR